MSVMQQLRGCQRRKDVWRALQLNLKSPRAVGLHIRVGVLLEVERWHPAVELLLLDLLEDVWLKEGLEVLDLLGCLVIERNNCRY